MSAAATEDSASSRRVRLLDQLAKIESLAMRIGLILIVCAVLYAVAIALSAQSPAQFLRIAFILVALIAAAAVAGGLLGFIFGIPRSLQRPGTAAAAPAADARPDGRAFGGNSSLEEISDWLTKIIVGVSLVEAGQIYNGLGTLAVGFQTAMLPDCATCTDHVAGGAVAFLIFSLAALILGFMFMNLETRTRITMLLEDAEFVRRGGPSEAAVKSANDAPISPEVDLTKAAVPAPTSTNTAPPSSGDAEILTKNFADLTTADEMAAWGAAQARAGNFAAAVKALNEAIARDPNNPGHLTKLAEIRQSQGDSQSAVTLLNEAMGKTPEPDPEALKRVLFNSLYLGPSQGFQTAIPVAEKLLQIPTAADNASVQLWIAAAYGQKYLWLTQNSGTAADLADARAKAMTAVRRVVELSPDPKSLPRVFLRRLFDPATENGPPTENDLECFKGDGEFRTAIYQGM